MPRNHATFIATVFLLTLVPVASSVGDQWDDQFGLRGIEGGPPAYLINDMWVNGTDLYFIGSMTAQDMLRWDGVAWSLVGAVTFSPISSALYAIVEHQGSIVVAGGFDAVNGQTGELAFWDGTTWSSAHSSLLETGVFALESDGTNLYMGVGGVMVVRYNGTIFEPLATSATSPCCVGPHVEDLLWWNDRLYAVGFFTSIDGLVLNHVGYWDGAQWNAMGAGASDLYPSRVFVHNDEIYICGNSRFAVDIRKWTGTQWVDAVTDNVTCEFGGGALDAMFFNGQLYQSSVDGTTSPGGTPVSGVVRWTGSAWDNMDGGVEGVDFCSSDGPGPLVEYDGRLVVVGGNTAGGMPSPGIALWDGDHWHANAPGGPVRVMVASGSDVYLAGEFEVAFETPVNHIARWNGSSWNALGSGVDGTIHDMVTIDSNLYVAGDFTDAGGSSADYIARWDGANWSAVGTAPIFGSVRALATDGVNLYAGGDFTMVLDGMFPQRLAKWDGTSWNDVGGGITNGSVEALACYDGDLYVGGTFTQAAYVTTGNVARWDGNAWATVGYGLGGQVRDLEVHAGVLYAGGDFTHSSTGPVNYVAAWNGASWDGLGPGILKGVSAPVHAMATVGGMLYVAGDFKTTAAGTTLNHIAGWDGTDWHPLGSGLNKRADALAVGAGAVFVGGEFSLAGGLGSHRFASWMLTPTTVAATRLKTTALEPAFPNPFNPETHIRYRVAQSGRITIAIYDAQGRRVRVLVDETHAGSPNERTITWDGSADDGSRVATGVYFVRMTAPGFDQSQKIVLLK